MKLNFNFASSAKAADMLFFNSEEFGKVRIFIDEKENVWFNLNDACKCLDLVNSWNASARLNENEKTNINVRNFDNSVHNMDETSSEDLEGNLHSMEGTSSKDLGGNPNMTYVSESGLYKVIFQSRKPNAAKFQDWVCGEVLPSIRKHGAYISEDLINDNRKLRETIKAMQEEQATNKEKIDFADICLECDTAHYINDLALYLNKYHIKIGQNQLFQKLIRQGYLYRRTDGSIFPKMEYVKRGYFTVVKGLKGKRTTSTVMVTDKGQMYFLNKLREEKSNENEVIELSLFES